MKSSGVSWETRLHRKPTTTALSWKKKTKTKTEKHHHQHLVSFPRVCGFKGTWGSGKSWMDNLTWQYYRVGGHRRQFPLPSVLHSTQLHYHTWCTVVLFCECSHQAGRDGECLTKAGRWEGVSRRMTCWKGLCLLHYLLHQVCTAPLKVYSRISIAF